MSDSPQARGREVVLTNAAKSKTFRLLSEWQIRDAVSNLDGTLYRRGESNEYHLIHDGHAIAVKPEGDQLVVITQMHVHNDYENLDTYREVGGYE